MWILIIVASMYKMDSGYRSQSAAGGVAVTTAEFTSKKKCEAAAAKAEASGTEVSSYTSISATCSEK
jgi:hypothetical protein